MNNTIDKKYENGAIADAQIEDEEGRGFAPESEDEQPSAPQPAPVASSPVNTTNGATPAAADKPKHPPLQNHAASLAIAEPKAATPPKAALQIGDKTFEIADIEQAYRAALMFSKSTLVAKIFIGQPENILVAMMWGRELGLSPMASLTGIAVVNGTPSLWGDAIPGLVYSSGLLVDHQETWEGEGPTRVAICRVIRKGQSEWHEQRFGYEDAKRAGLLSKDTYKSYPDRMYMNRARAFAFRTKFADVLRGLPIAEELQDYPGTASTTTASAVSEPVFGRLQKEETTNA